MFKNKCTVCTKASLLQLHYNLKKITQTFQFEMEQTRMLMEQAVVMESQLVMYIHVHIHL